MRIETRLTTVTALIFAAAALIAGTLSYRIEIAQAREEVNATAQVLIDAASAVRHYTNNEIPPRATAVPDKPSQPQQVPAYAAQATMVHLRAQYPQFQYHEASVNPT